MYQIVNFRFILIGSSQRKKNFCDVHSNANYGYRAPTCHIFRQPAPFLGNQSLYIQYIIKKQIVNSLRQKNKHRQKTVQILAGLVGLEPATFCVTGRRSNQLSYNP